MGCCGQNSTGAAPVAVDTGKRVNYTLGMLLGVDDFLQEQAYNGARRRELARELLGYGTARGLQVALEPATVPQRVRVSPGMAWLPSGTPVCVPGEQCCDIDGWLDRHKAELGPVVAGSPPAVAVYVVLSYSSCLTDNVPIPGEPCRSEDELMQPSRVADCFSLELRLAPPPQVEEDAVRDFADWLSRVPVDVTSPPQSETDFIDALREAATAWLTPGSPPPSDFMFGSPPVGLSDSEGLLRAALRLWVTELRPLWRARYGCGPNPDPEGTSDDALLLAELQLPLAPKTGGGWVAAGPALVDESRRPILASLRLLQELIAQSPAPDPALSVVPALSFGLPSDVGIDKAYARADHSHGTPLLPDLAGDVTGPVTANLLTRLRGHGFAATAANPGDVLAVDGAGLWAPRRLPLVGGNPTTAQQFGLPLAAGASADFARADHSHGTPTLSGDATVVVESGAQRVRVEGLRRTPIAATAPKLGDILVLRSAGGAALAWTPEPLPGGQAAVVPATEVFNATAPGLAPAVGSSLAYARADHSHGTPPAVQPGTAVTAAALFGQAVAVGSAATFARADHSHGTPTLRGDAVSVQNPNGAQDVRVVALQGVPLATTAPAAGQVLTFANGSWTPAAAPTGGVTGNFVGRAANPYALVAAGEAVVTVTATAGPTVATPSSYSGLVATGVTAQATELRVAFRANVDKANDAKARYIVKLTPVWRTDSKNEFQPYLLNAVGSEGSALILFTVRLRVGTDIAAGMVFQFQLEVSRYEV